MSDSQQTVNKAWNFAHVLRDDGLSYMIYEGLLAKSAADLDDFVACYNPENRHNRKATFSDSTPEGRGRCFAYEEYGNVMGPPVAKRSDQPYTIFMILAKPINLGVELPLERVAEICRNC